MCIRDSLTDLARDQARRDVSVRMSNTEALERLRQRGYVDGKGKLWGRNNCLADSLFQLLVRHRVIYWDPANGACVDDVVVRPDLCNRNRDHLCLHETLHPLGVRGERDPDAYLQHHVHGGPTIEFFMKKVPVLDGIPEAGVVIRVHTKHDEVVGGEGSVDSWPVLQWNGSGRAGLALVLHLFCHTLPGGEGFHYDPLFRDDDDGPAASASGSADQGPLPVVVVGDDVEVVEAKRQSVDDRHEAKARTSTGMVPGRSRVIQVIESLSDQRAEASRIARALEQTDFEVEEVLLDEPALVVEARPQSLESADRIGVNAARTAQDEERSARASEQMLVGADVLDATRQTVAYTHLTLPTLYSV